MKKMDGVTPSNGNNGNNQGGTKKLNPKLQEKAIIISFDKTKLKEPVYGEYMRKLDKETGLPLNNPDIMADFKLVEQGKMTIEEFTKKYFESKIK